jgi:hypothetical protein
MAEHLLELKDTLAKARKRLDGRPLRRTSPRPMTRPRRATRRTHPR